MEIAAENDNQCDGIFGCTITHASPWIAQYVSKSMDDFRALRYELLMLEFNAEALDELPAPLRLFTKAQSHNHKYQAHRDACSKLLTMVGQSEFLASSVPVRRFLFAPPKPLKPELTLRLATPTASSIPARQITHPSGLKSELILRVAWALQPDWPVDAVVKVDCSFTWCGLRYSLKPTYCSASSAAAEMDHKLEEGTCYRAVIQFGRDFSRENVPSDWGAPSEPDSIEVPHVCQTSAFRHDVNDKIYLCKPEPPRHGIEVGLANMALALRLSWDRLFVWDRMVSNGPGPSDRAGTTRRLRIDYFKKGWFQSRRSKVVDADDVIGSSVLLYDVLLEECEYIVSVRLGRGDIDTWGPPSDEISINVPKGTFEAKLQEDAAKKAQEEAAKKAQEEEAAAKKAQEEAATQV